MRAATAPSGAEGDPRRPETFGGGSGTQAGILFPPPQNSCECCLLAACWLLPDTPNPPHSPNTSNVRINWLKYSLLQLGDHSQNSILPHLH